MSLRERLIRDEGYVRHAYVDTRGVTSAGVGFNIDPHHGGSIPDIVIDFWLTVKIQEAEEALDRNLAWWRSRPEPVQEAMSDMCYQLGIGGLLGFRKLLAALHAGDWGTAQAEGRDSEWYKQTPARAEEVIALFCSGLLQTDPVPTTEPPLGQDHPVPPSSPV